VHIGPYDARSIETGTFALDGGAMFGVVPKPLWEIHPQRRTRVHWRASILLKVAGRRSRRQAMAKPRPDGRIFNYHTRPISSLPRRGGVPPDSTCHLTHRILTCGGEPVDDACYADVPNARYYVRPPLKCAHGHGTDRALMSEQYHRYESTAGTPRRRWESSRHQTAHDVYGQPQPAIPLISYGAPPVYCAIGALPTHVQLPWIMDTI